MLGKKWPFVFVRPFFPATRVIFMSAKLPAITQPVVVSLCLFFPLPSCPHLLPSPASFTSGGGTDGSCLTFPDDWMPLIMARQTSVQAASKARVIFQLRPPLSEMLSEMSRAWRYQ